MAKAVAKAKAKTTKKDKIVAIDFDWTKVGENVQRNAEQISKNIMKNAPMKPILLGRITITESIRMKK